MAMLKNSLALSGERGTMRLQKKRPEVRGTRSEKNTTRKNSLSQSKGRRMAFWSQTLFVTVID